MWCFLEETINDNQLRKRYFQTGEYVNTKNHHCLWLIGWRKMKGADCELHPLIHTFTFRGLGTKCWGRSMVSKSFDVLPIPKIGLD
jgi:hypothetical protein